MSIKMKMNMFAIMAMVLNGSAFAYSSCDEIAKVCSNISANCSHEYELRMEQSWDIQAQRDQIQSQYLQMYQQCQQQVGQCWQQYSECLK